MSLFVLSSIYGVYIYYDEQMILEDYVDDPNVLENLELIKKLPENCEESVERTLKLERNELPQNIIKFFLDILEEFPFVKNAKWNFQDPILGEIISKKLNIPWYSINIDVEKLIYEQFPYIIKEDPQKYLEDQKNFAILLTEKKCSNEPEYLDEEERFEEGT